MKEGSANNLIEHNICEQQQDPNSGCFGLRGSDNTVRWNDIAECKGAGVRVGGDRSFGTNNNIYGNNIKNADAGAFSVHSPDQGTVCENNISGVDKIVSVIEFDLSLQLRLALLPSLRLSCTCKIQLFRTCCCQSSFCNFCLFIVSC